MAEPPDYSGEPVNYAGGIPFAIDRTRGFDSPDVDGQLATIFATRDGSLRVAELAHTLGLAGRVFAVNYGQGTTFVTAKTGFTAAQPDFDLDIPSGTAVIPLGLFLAFGAMTGTVNHFFVQVAAGLVGAGTSTAATAGPLNMSIGTAIPSLCTARQAYSGNGTAPAAPLEVFAVEDPTAATGSVPLTFEWQPVTFAPIIGPACIVGYGVSTTTALTFKAVLVYAELPAQYAQ